MSIPNSASLDPGSNYYSIVMGLPAIKLARSTEDGSAQQTDENSQGESTSFNFGIVPRKRRSAKPIILAGWRNKGLPETNNPGIQGLPSTNDNVYQGRGKSIPDVSISNSTGANRSSFRSLRVRGQRRGHINSSLLGKLDSKTFEDFMEHVWSTCPGERRKSFYRIDSLWFHLYSKKPSRERVLNWVKKKDIFSKKYVLVPIVLWSHWSLLILCNFGKTLQTVSPCMLLLDSLQETNPRRLEPGIRKFILDVYHSYQIPVTTESIQKIPFLIPKASCFEPFFS
ncbi:OLC1v1035086C3 [Oldenlandia corymbosa var. corymbosa]|uniref:OLC1v1035086C3 n=1 Tax=Oldenlandia corymbosa var. corymbosa TaxID=529605 RepID=A0AAV1CS92_OLDCO|nr:OLC1v1035086C3 [Oldenlandia corymbosa var. corymbosa]